MATVPAGVAAARRAMVEAVAARRAIGEDGGIADHSCNEGAEGM